MLSAELLKIIVVPNFDSKLTLPVEKSEQAGVSPEGGGSAEIRVHAHPSTPSSAASPLPPTGLTDGPSPVDRGSHIPREKRPDGKLGRRALLSHVASQEAHIIPGSLPMGVFLRTRHTFLNEFHPSLGHKFPFHHPPVP